MPALPDAASHLAPDAGSPDVELARRVRDLLVVRGLLTSAARPAFRFGRTRLAVPCRAPDGRRLVALVARRPASLTAAEGLRREATALALLSQVELPFSVPVHAGWVVDQALTISLISRLPGTSLVAGDESLGELARVLASLHAASVPPRGLPGHRDASEHARALTRRALAAAAGVACQGPRATLERWDRAPEPAVFLHGDLVAHNVLLSGEHLLSGRHTGVIDWEWAQRGDPAHDLAVSLRFDAGDAQVAELVSRYNDLAPWPVQVADVQRHRLARAVLNLGRAHRRGDRASAERFHDWLAAWSDG